VCSLGGMVVLTGKPKARKTTFLHTILGSAITNKPIYDIYTNLPSNKQKVVLIDTEQSNYDLYKSSTRLANTIGTEVSNLGNMNFSIYSTRLLTAIETIKLIDTILEEQKDIGIIAIDSLLDLVNDLNDIAESKAVITKIKTWLDTYKISIVTVIHQSKSTNYSLGHLGSFASRFCQSEIAVIKNEDSTSTLEATYLRSDENFNPITIGYNEALKTYQQVLNNKNLTIEQYNHRQIIDSIYASTNEFNYKQLLEVLKVQYAGNSAYWVQNHLVPYLYANRFIVKHKNSILKVR
jgi:hypothetical protein